MENHLHHLFFKLNDTVMSGETKLCYFQNKIVEFINKVSTSWRFIIHLAWGCCDIAEGGRKGGPTVGGPILEPGGPIFGPGGPILEPGGPIFGPGGPILEPGGPILGPGGPILVPGAPPIFGPGGPIFGPGGAPIPPAPGGRKGPLLIAPGGRRGVDVRGPAPARPFIGFGGLGDILPGGPPACPFVCGGA